MTLFHHKIRQRFNTASTSYDLVADAQRQAANFLVNKSILMISQPINRILDLGTGTGYIPKLLLPHYPQAQYVLNDMSDSMLMVCRNHFNHLSNFSFMGGDMESLIVAPCDIILSNFALQWVSRLEATLQKYHALATQIFAFSTLVHGTFAQWYNTIKRYEDVSLHQYPNVENVRAYCHAIQGNGHFTYTTMDITITANNAIDLMQYFKKLGASLTHDAISLRTINALRRDYTTPFTVTYKVFFGFFVKG